jgi:endonuclease/exonuclease/phosphatase (EEP) superfamily protein YafD
MTRLTRELDRLHVTTICLQEVQQNAYAPLVRRGLTSYPYHVFERHRYAPKGGLAIFSRLPLARHRFEVYQDRGTWYSISFADWALYKGILLVHLEVDGLEIAVLNTHMNANYTGEWHRETHLSRIQNRQVEQLIRTIHSIPEDTLLIVSGDLNFPRTSLLYKELISGGGLLDPLVNDPRSTYRPFPLVSSKWKIPLDYVLYRQPAWKDVQVSADLIEIEDTSKKHPVQRFLTDHNGLLLKIMWHSAIAKQSRGAQR